ncbi:unnamed protein product [Chironomus riparius]|uniref:Cathepsin propeptide inhibitor domain-containing protein n=1 Tax=Chironomus riparius TaxID=315576 RepID=A0A9N9RVK1_9DIPT|nr:unnamed protein product [Chironomus riparius]
MSKLVLVVILLIIGLITFNHALSIEAEWTNYKQKYNKNYGLKEDAERFEYFKDSLRRIEEGNAKSIREGSSFRMGVNHLADISPEEWRIMSHGVRMP